MSNLREYILKQLMQRCKVKMFDFKSAGEIELLVRLFFMQWNLNDNYWAFQELSKYA